MQPKRDSGGGRARRHATIGGRKMTAPQPNNENERLTLEFFATLGSGDLEGVRALLHEDATWTPMVKDIPGAGKHIGRKGIVDEFLMPIRGMFRPGDPKVLVDTIASNGSLVITETRGKGALADADRDGADPHIIACFAKSLRVSIVPIP